MTNMDLSPCPSNNKPAIECSTTTCSRSNLPLQAYNVALMKPETNKTSSPQPAIGQAPTIISMPPSKGKKVLLAMSGGVDSSVTAALLKEEGFEVVGCFMRNGAIDSFEQDASQNQETCDLDINADPQQPGTPGRKANRQGCCSVNDAADARLVSAMLDIPFYVMNFKKDFSKIINYFVDDYNAGRTPNPCVRCNDWLKFGKLVDYAKSIDAHYVATGHYARVDRGTNSSDAGGAGASSTATRPRLLRGLDHHKDQSYVLFGTKRDRLERMILPIGNFKKADVRKIAEEKGLPIYNKPDSYEICFVPDNNYRNFIKQKTPDAFEPGKLVDTQGNELGEHQGHQNFTIGQRRGLGLAKSSEQPLYVINKNAHTNTVILGDVEQTTATGLTANETNWLIDNPPTEPIDVLLQIRSNGETAPGKVWTTGPDSLQVQFNQPHRAVSPGQAVVCYLGEELIGGGWINETVTD
jgi:tRNA-uridine 2-sulfurtransferase